MDRSDNKILESLAFALRSGEKYDPVMIIFREMGLTSFTGGTGIGLNTDVLDPQELHNCQMALEILDMSVLHTVIVVPSYQALEWLCRRYDLYMPKLLHQGPPNSGYPGNIWYVAEWLKCHSNSRNLTDAEVAYIKNDLSLYAISLIDATRP